VSPQRSPSLQLPHQNPVHPLPHLILIHFITHTLLGEEYRLLSSPLCSFLHPPVTSSLLGPSIQLWITEGVETKHIHTSIKNSKLQSNCMTKIQLACTWLSASHNSKPI
jgi:hypothetical protein